MIIKKRKKPDSMFVFAEHQPSYDVKKLETEDIDVEEYLKNAFYALMPNSRVVYSEDYGRAEINIKVITFYKGYEIKGQGTTSFNDILGAKEPMEYLRQFVKEMYNVILDEFDKVSKANFKED